MQLPSVELYSSKMPPSITAKKKNREFDPDVFLATIGDGRKILAVLKKQTIFAQGDEADAVFYVQQGKVSTNTKVWTRMP
jgi:CRP-like cAMP-binding protein